MEPYSIASALFKTGSDTGKMYKYQETSQKKTAASYKFSSGISGVFMDKPTLGHAGLMLEVLSRKDLFVKSFGSAATEKLLKDASGKGL